MCKNDKENGKKEKNLPRRDFLKKLSSSALFIIPAIETFSLLKAQESNYWWWTGHHQHEWQDDPHHDWGPGPPPPPNPNNN